MMDFIYLVSYVLCLLANLRLVGFSSSWKTLGLQRTGTNGEGRKWTLAMIFCVILPSRFPAPWQIEGPRDEARVFVLGLLTATLARGHTLALSSKSTLHFVLIAQLSYHSCLAPRLLWSLSPKA